MRKKNKNIYIIAVILFLFCISAGYAVLSRTLNITGNSEIKHNTWNLYFDKVKVTAGSIEAVNAPAVNNNNLSVNFDFFLNLPGDFYEFTVDVINSGSIDAMIESIIKIPELTEAQEKYLNYIIEYQNGDQIALNQLVESDSFVRLKVRVEYKKDILESDMPLNEEILNLGFSLNYVQSDQNAVLVKNNGVIGANGDINEIGTIVTIGTEKFYTIGTEGDNVKLLSMYNLYVGNECTSSTTCIPYGDEATGKQDLNMAGYRLDRPVRKGTIAFSNNSTSYNGSIVEGHVNNYKTNLEEEFGVDVVEARLITHDELTSKDIGCSSFSCSNAPGFIYEISYWTGSARNDNFVWGVDTYGAFGITYSNAYHLGVRPLIIVSKSLF